MHRPNQEHVSGTNSYSFDAFISYSSDDGQKARWIQRFLQSYRRRNLKKALTVYLDRTDVRGGPLKPELEDALRRSKHLIVCCSEAAAKSKWVTTEVSSYCEHHEDPFVALLLLSGEPSQSIPMPARNLELRYHDLRHGGPLWRYSSKSREELLRLLALLTGQDLRSLIDWNRRRTIWRAAVAIISLIVLTGATNYYVEIQRTAAPSDITARILYTDAEFQGDDNTVGEALKNLFVDDTVLKIVGALKGSDQEAMQVKWPFSASGFHSPNAPARLESSTQTRDIMRSVSVDGTQTRSLRTFQQFNGTLGPLANRSQWSEARFEARVESVVPRGTKVPKPRAPNEFAAKFNQHYNITAEERELYEDYQISPIPIRAELEILLDGVVVGKAVGFVARIRAWDEDVSNTHVVYFPAIGAKP